jgi:type II secretory pathway pseudopilin PulG
MTTRSTGSPAAAARGAVLLEVLLALMLFAVTAAIITSSMNASMDGLERLKRNTHAANLAATTFAELELGLRPADASGEQALEKPFEAWTCEVSRVGAENESGEASDLTQLEVILRHKDSDLVYRQMQWLKLPAAKAATDETPLTAGTTGGVAP